jgi:hypothetical protein
VKGNLWNHAAVCELSGEKKRQFKAMTRGAGTGRNTETARQST